MILINKKNKIHFFFFIFSELVYKQKNLNTYRYTRVKVETHTQDAGRKSREYPSYENYGLNDGHVGFL